MTRGKATERLLLVQIGSLSHNRRFTTRELRETARRDESRRLRRFVERGWLSRDEDGLYYPTKEGWVRVEEAIEEYQSLPIAASVIRR